MMVTSPGVHRSRDRGPYAWKQREVSESKWTFYRPSSMLHKSMETLSNILWNWEKWTVRNFL